MERIMTVARHPMPPEVAGLALEEIAQKYVARFRDRKPDWDTDLSAVVANYIEKYQIYN